MGRYAPYPLTSWANVAKRFNYMAEMNRTRGYPSMDCPFNKHYWVKSRTGSFALPAAGVSGTLMG